LFITNVLIVSSAEQKRNVKVEQHPKPQNKNAQSASTLSGVPDDQRAAIWRKQIPSLSLKDAENNRPLRVQIPRAIGGGRVKGRAGRKGKALFSKRH
jgi:hypothetical protein